MGDSGGQQQAQPGRRKNRGKRNKNKNKTPDSQSALMPTPPAMLPLPHALLPKPQTLMPTPLHYIEERRQCAIRGRLLKLIDKACQHLKSKGSHLEFSPFFYRDKSQGYYQHILGARGGLMEVYTKDYHGDQLSPINGRLDGLFFSVNMDERTGRLPSRSIYGEMRLVVPSPAILARYHNLYFTDFYCISKPVHYVTLVMTRPGSPADHFCRQNLIQLDWETNAFLRVFFVLSPDGFRWDPNLFVTSKVWVEVFYTEDVMIPHMVIEGAHFKQASMQGHRSGGRQGLPKKSNCPICNV